MFLDGNGEGSIMSVEKNGELVNDFKQGNNWVGYIVRGNDMIYPGIQTFFTSGTQDVVFPAGTYQFVIRGAGGQGGYNNTGGDRLGGAGGKGGLNVVTLTFTTLTTVTIYVGSNGGSNGGAAGDGTDAPSSPGAGGAGGYPSYIKVNGTVYGATGGGGGGGAGGSDTNSGRYSDGASGGGGGGYYQLNSDGSITSVPGQKGGKGAVITS